ncbi:MAG: sporulation protein YtfJ [Clostridiales bacterium]|jgi:sporulation protein YtfJ|nr:sporulation protein YtfJ [Clostridiales bacterium]
MSENTNNSIKEAVETALEGLKGIANINTIVGQALETKDGTVIIPVSKVSLGFGLGGSSLFPKNDISDNGMAGGGGGGVTIDPVAFLVVSGGDVRLMYMQGDNKISSNLISAIPGVVDTLIDVFANKKGSADKSDTNDLNFEETQEFDLDDILQ